MPVTESPLRYPGGKTQMKKFIIDLIQTNISEYKSKSYVEPFAGGAGLALSLLFSEYVSEIHINDYDRNIYGIWYSILNCPNEFISLIEETPITLTEWEKQQRIRNEDVDLLKTSFATFFLNRTNVSGIIDGGPIGGRAQKSKYKLDCRYNKEKLIQKVNRIHSFKDRIHLTNKDAEDFICNDISQMDDSSTFVFFDPPYYKQGKNLYTNYYNHDDHVSLSRKILNLRNYKWITTYDDHEAIREIYSSQTIRQYSLNYSANKVRKASEFLIHNDNTIIPNSNNIIFTDEMSMK
ncbi:DNA adenine methylase [Halobacillus litoralis]|uniref:site-specific DNA-methyltransferase (adenine-specific) n=1 Tax=Halobacillus litoralis TaxID=45668 RepID=A0A845E7Z0_9BACI|nr:DNA adenine methylase [Halobacillus litoralis]MYL50289.1 DNA adenine methylase [Halobacillus litoralis]